MLTNGVDIAGAHGHDNIPGSGNLLQIVFHLGKIFNINYFLTGGGMDRIRQFPAATPGIGSSPAEKI
jgi:hypothetical protein